MSFTPRRSAKISVCLAVAAYVLGGRSQSEPAETSGKDGMETQLSWQECVGMRIG